MLAFRQSLAEVIRERLLVRRGYPPAEHTLLRRRLLALFCRSGRQQNVKSFLLATLPNGNWLNTEAVEVWVAPGFFFDHSTVSDHIVKGLLNALSGKIFTTYNNSKWLGCDVAIDEIGLAQAVHGLAAASFRRMLEKRRPGQAQIGELQYTAEQSAPDELEPTTPLQSEAPDPHPAGTDEAGLSAAEASAVGANSAEGIDPALISPQKWSELTTQRQRVAMKWLEANPLAYLMLIRMTLTPIANLLRTYIARSGERWTQQHRARLAQRLEGRLPANMDVPLPPMMEFATQSAERVFFQEWQDLLSVTTWDLLPDETKQISFQALAFRLLSQMGAMVHQLLVVPSRAFPAKLLLILVDVSHATDVLASRPCLRDSYTHDFIQRFGDAGLESKDAAAVLWLLAMTSSPETVSTEWGHSRVHRILCGASQVQKPSMEYLNSQVVAMQHRRRVQASGLKEGAGRSGGAPGAEEEQGVAAGAEVAAKRRGGGGEAWRAFCSLRKRGTSGASDFQTLAEEYREAKRLRTAEYLEAEASGRAGTERHKESGVPSFGPPPRSIRRSQARKQPPNANPEFHWKP